MKQPLATFRIVQALASLVVFQTTFAVISAYGGYFPPDFRSDFLLGRRDYFFGLYPWAFYAHIIVGPLVLASGLLLLSESFRRRSPKWHRRLGRAHIVCVLLILSPSGLWMSLYADGGSSGRAAFALLAIATAICAAMGWRSAVQRQFEQHRLWMLRCYVLLCSTVVLRKLGGLAELAEVEWTYPFAAWLSWAPMLMLEVWRAIRSRSSRLHRLSA